MTYSVQFDKTKNLSPQHIAGFITNLDDSIFNWNGYKPQHGKNGEWFKVTTMQGKSIVISTDLLTDNIDMTAEHEDNYELLNTLALKISKTFNTAIVKI